MFQTVIQLFLCSSSEIYCDPPPIVTNAEFTTPPSTVTGTVIMYHCEEGLRFIDGETHKALTCSWQGFWEGIDSDCAGNLGLIHCIM